MAGITLAQAEENLADSLAALKAVRSGQSYEINGRRLTRADLAEIRADVQFWDVKVKSLARGGLVVRGATPIG